MKTASKLIAASVALAAPVAARDADAPSFDEVMAKDAVAPIKGNGSESEKPKFRGAQRSNGQPDLSSLFGGNGQGGNGLNNLFGGNGNGGQGLNDLLGGQGGGNGLNDLLQGLQKNGGGRGGQQQGLNNLMQNLQKNSGRGQQQGAPKGNNWMQNLFGGQNYDEEPQEDQYPQQRYSDPYGQQQRAYDPYGRDVYHPQEQRGMYDDYEQPQYRHAQDFESPDYYGNQHAARQQQNAGNGLFGGNNSPFGNLFGGNQHQTQEGEDAVAQIRREQRERKLQAEREQLAKKQRMMQLQRLQQQRALKQRLMAERAQKEKLMAEREEAAKKAQQESAQQKQKTTAAAEPAPKPEGRYSAGKAASEEGKPAKGLKDGKVVSPFAAEEDGVEKKAVRKETRGEETKPAADGNKVSDKPALTPSELENNEVTTGAEDKDGIVHGDVLQQ